jgi:hypothetical protein
MNDEYKYKYVPETEAGFGEVSITSNPNDYILPDLPADSEQDADTELQLQKTDRVLVIDADTLANRRLGALLHTAHIEPALDSHGHITEVSIVPDHWTNPGIEEIRQNIEAVGNADTAVPRPITVLPKSFLDAFLSAPRKLKKSWNTSGLFVSLRSNRGRRDTRKHAQQLRKLERDLKTGVIKP